MCKWLAYAALSKIRSLEWPWQNHSTNWPKLGILDKKVLSRILRARFNPTADIRHPTYVKQNLNMVN